MRRCPASTGITVRHRRAIPASAPLRVMAPVERQHDPGRTRRQSQPTPRRPGRARRLSGLARAGREQGDEQHRAAADPQQLRATGSRGTAPCKILRERGTRPRSCAERAHIAARIPDRRCRPAGVQVRRGQLDEYLSCRARERPANHGRARQAHDHGREQHPPSPTHRHGRATGSRPRRIAMKRARMLRLARVRGPRETATRCR